MKNVIRISLIIGALAAATALWAGQTARTGPANASEIDQRVVTYLRKVYAWGPQFNVVAGTPEPSPIPDLYRVPVTISLQGQTEKAVVYVTRSGKYMLRGVLDNLLIDPFAAVREKLETAVGGHPHAGPAKACVNVAEFFDYECPHCRDAHLALKEIEPHYPQVRFTYFDFPLSQIHPWAYNAALAGRCAYQENAADYPKLQDLIFDNQEKITATNAATMIPQLAAQAGYNSSQVQACMASPATHQMVDSDVALGKTLKEPGFPGVEDGVDSTPTLFINGHPMVGGTVQQLAGYIEYELGQCKAAGK